MPNSTHPLPPERLPLPPAAPPAGLRCWAFNPPGGLLSWNLSQLSQRFCTAVVVGKDVISRLSFTTAKRLVDEMVVSLARWAAAQLSKPFMLQSRLFSVTLVACCGMHHVWRRPTR